MGKKLIYTAREELEPRLMTAVGGILDRASWDQCRLLGAWLGLAIYAGMGRRRNISVSNVRVAFPHISRARAAQISRRAAMNFGMTFAEFMHLRTATMEEVVGYCSEEGKEHIEDALALGRGVILLTAHLGNWEVMGARARMNFPLSVVARPSSNAGIDAHINACRAAQGIQVISKYETGRASLKVLKENRALAILPDQHAGPEGLLLPMFGQPTRFIPAVARLSMVSGAPIVPVFGVRRAPWISGGGIVAKVRPSWIVENPGKDPAAREAAVEAGTRRVISEIESIVRSYPDQWLWLHRRWRPADGAVLPC